MSVEVDLKRDEEVLAEIIALAIAENESYTYADKIGYAPSRDMLAFYLREVLRDFHTILRNGVKNNEKAKSLLKKILERFERSQDPVEGANQAIDRIFQEIGNDRKKLREVSSMIAAKALAISARYMKD